MTAGRSLVPVGVAVLLAVGTTSVTRPGGPRTVQLDQNTLEVLEPAGLSAGPPGAAPVVTIVTDYECGACEALDRQAGRVLRSWAREGRIRYRVVHAPLARHRRAPRAATAFYCADGQGAAWPMHDMIVAGRPDWGWGEDPRGAFTEYASMLGLEQDRFRACLEAESAQLARDRSVAATLGITSVPVILVDSTLLQPSRSFDEVLRYVEDQLQGTG